MNIGIIGQGFVGNAVYNKFKNYYNVLTFDLDKSLCNSSFEEINKEFKDKNTEVILVSLDFPSQIETKLKPYLKRNKIKSRVILLDDSKMNTWVPKVSEQWDGGIPATLIVNSSNYNFYPKPFKKEELYTEINKAINK